MITIIKSKLLSGDKVEIDFQKQNDNQKKPIDGTEKAKEPPHIDLVNAFAALDIHAALLGEFVPVVNVPDIANPDKAILDKFHVSGITIVKPGHDDEGVIITAGKTLNTGRHLGFNTPTTRFNDTSDNKYQYLDELQKAVEVITKETILYLGGKYAPVVVQGKIDLEEHEGQDEENQ